MNHIIKLRGERDVIRLRNPTEDMRAFQRMLTSADHHEFDDILPMVLSCSKAAPIENKMACSRPRKRSKKDVEKALQESIDDCNRLLESSKKPRKKTRFRISRDPVTGRRNIHCGYQPRFRDQPGTSSCQGEIK